MKNSGAFTTVAVFVLLWMGSVGISQADRSTDTRRLMLEAIKNKDTDSAAWNALLRKGEDRASFCTNCHGKDGISVMSLVPNLAGQNPFFLLDQIERFADGRRKDYIMSPLAQQYGPEDRVAVAAFFSSMPPRVNDADQALAAKGQARFQQTCVGCHGTDAHGGEDHARLAGQNAQYLKHRLFFFQQSQSVSGEAPTVMNGLAKDLSDQDIDAIAAYLTSHP